MPKRGKTSKSPKAKQNMKREAEKQEVKKKDTTTYYEKIRDVFKKRTK